MASLPVLFSSPEPLGIRRPSDVRPSVVRPSSTFSKILFFETIGPIETIFHVEPTWVGGTKVCSPHLGYMIKMLATPIFGKTLQNFLLQNRRADDLESWYVP